VENSFSVTKHGINKIASGHRKRILLIAQNILPLTWYPHDLACGSIINCFVLGFPFLTVPDAIAAKLYADHPQSPRRAI